MIAILDADKEGFLRSATSLIQTSGRAARHLAGHVIMYADRVTDSMKIAIDETDRRRAIQRKYNEDNNITPTSIKKSIMATMVEAESCAATMVEEEEEEYGSVKDLRKFIAKLEKQMYASARELEFEKAAKLRDRIQRLQEKELELG